MKQDWHRLAALVLLGGLAACGGDEATAPTVAGREGVQVAVGDPTPTLIVTSADDAGPGTLREAVTNAPDGAVIGFDGPVVGINLVTEIVIPANRTLTIQGPDARIFVNGVSQTRHFRVSSGSSLTLRHIWLQNGTADFGGSISAEGPVALDDVLATSNTATGGGGVIYSVQAPVTIRSSRFESNSSGSGPGAALRVVLGAVKIDTSTFVSNTNDGLGGAIEMTGGSLAVRGGLFQENVAGYGGAISTDGTVIRITETTFLRNASRVFGGAFLTSEATKATIDSSAFTSNTAGEDAGAVSSWGQTTITSSVFTGNSAVRYGGAVHVFRGSTTIAGSRFASNSAKYGGAIASEAIATTEVNANLIQENIATRGGGLHLQGTSTLVQDTIVSNAATAEEGGGVWAAGKVVVTNSSIRNNQSANGGGGMRLAGDASQLLMTGTTLDGNKASGGGGLLMNGVAVIRTSTVSRNSALQGGGGGVVSNLDLTLENSTITANTAATSGGALFGLGTVTLRQVTLVGNSSSTLAAISRATAPGKITSTGLIISGNTSASGSGCSSGYSVLLAGTTLTDDPTCAFGGTVVSGPANLGPLADNGGPTLTHALLTGSAAIDAGGTCTVTTDQRGNARPQGAACDLGAYEFNDFIAGTATIDPSGTVNTSTGVAFVSGTVTCTGSSPISFEVAVQQVQKVGKINTTVQATTRVTTTCGSARAWSAALTPATGAFSTAPMTVTARSITGGVVLPFSVTRTGVKMSWSKR